VKPWLGCVVGFGVCGTLRFSYYWRLECPNRCLIGDPPRNSMDKGNATQRGRWLCKLLNGYNTIFISVARIAANLPLSKVSAKLSLTTLLALTICSPVSRHSQWLTEFRGMIMPNSWSEDDMGRLKDHLRKHPLDSSTNLICRPPGNSQRRPSLHSQQVCCQKRCSHYLVHDSSHWDIQEVETA
jgi:hypothetical protein